MKKFIQQKLKDQKGMTLIELLAVIVIIAIIAAIAIPAIGNIIENSRVGAIKSDAQNAIAAANIYYTDDPAATSPVPVSLLLTNDYLQDAGSLTPTTNIAKVSGGNTLSGQGETGGITLDFTDVTNSDINLLKNSDDDITAATGKSSATAAIAVTGR